MADKILKDRESNVLDDMIGGTVEFLSDTAVQLVEAVLWAVNRILFVFIKLIKLIIGSFKLIMKHIPRIVTPVMPEKSRSGLNQTLIYAGVEMTAEEVVSITLVYSLVVVTITYLLTVFFGTGSLIGTALIIVSFIIVWVAPFILLNMLSSNRAVSVETTLPEILNMVAQNITAGMTSYNALWNSARPEFGPLAVEIQEVAKATLTGMPLMDALMGMTNHIDSVRLTRVIRLMIQGMKSGGELPTVLYAISNDMRAEDNLKKQMAAETSAQTVFILFAIVIGAPLLFAVSTEFVTIFSTMMTKLNVEELAKNSPQSMISLSQLAISPPEFKLYSVVTLGISSFFASLFMGVLKTGKAIDGITSIPPLVIVSITAYLVLNFGMNTLFAGMLNF